MKFYDVAKDYIERMEYLEQGINAETGEFIEEAGETKKENYDDTIAKNLFKD